MINAKDFIDSKYIKSIDIARWPGGGKYDEVVT
jgi:hypothetical protein